MLIVIKNLVFMNLIVLLASCPEHGHNNDLSGILISGSSISTRSSTIYLANAKVIFIVKACEFITTGAFIIMI